MALMIGIAGPELRTVEAQWLRDRRVCGVILFKRNFVDKKQTLALCSAIRSVRPRLLIAVDQEGGVVQRFHGEGFTDLPAFAELSAAMPSAINDHAARIALEVRAAGLDLSFTPVVDVGRGNRAIGSRAFSPDALVCADIGARYVRALQRHGMAATLKHFPGHGSVLADTHFERATDPRTLAQIAIDDLVPFAAGIAAGARAVMMAHVDYPAVCAQAAGYSRRWIVEILRRDLGFRGAIISDDIGMAAAFGAGDVGARIDAHETAGCDIVLVCDPALVDESLRAATAITPLSTRLQTLLRARRAIADANRRLASRTPFTLPTQVAAA